jgi:hypothetical protein
MDPGIFKFLQVMLTIAGTVTGSWVVILLVTALARRIEGGGPADSELQRKLDELRARVEDGETLRARVAELEERLDFAERMLAGHREQSRIGRGAETG